MTAPADPSPGGVRILVMLAFGLWTLALAVGFGYAVVAGADELSALQAALYVALAVLLAAGSARTFLELARLRRR